MNDRTDGRWRLPGPRTVVAGIFAVIAAALGLVAGFLAFAASNDRTGGAAVNALSGLGTAFLVSATIAAGVLWLLGSSRALWRGGMVGLASAAVPVVFLATLNAADAARATPGEAPRELIVALAEESHLLATVEPGADPNDLEPFRRAWSGRRVVALGEATHGTSEFFLMKHRLVEFLVTELGFRHFAMETHPERHGPYLDDYVRGGTTSPERVLYWPWATAEYVALLDWMRAFNRDRAPDDRIVFHGIDPQEGERDRAMAENVLALLDSVAPGGKVIVWAANSHVRGALGGMGEYLKERLGDEAYLLGLEFHQGAFTSRMRTIQTYQEGPFPPSYYSHALAQLPGSVRFLDFTSASRHPEVERWLAEARVSNHLFEMYSITRFIRSVRMVREPWVNLFDGVVFIEESTPATSPSWSSRAVEDTG